MKIQMAATVYWVDHPNSVSQDPALLKNERLASEYLYATLSTTQPDPARNTYIPKELIAITPSPSPGGKRALVSPFGGYYSFGFEIVQNKPTNWVLVDPGRDKLLGGTLSAESGFVPDNTDANGDGNADHLDNLIEKVSLR